MDKAELLRKVRHIEIKSRGLSNHLFSGEYHSAFKGKGMSFSEVREYSFGDDVKNIDWNVTARLGTPYIKIFEEERELTVMLLVDVSGSAFFGTQAQTKNELITELCAVLAFSAITNNDKVGILFFSDTVQKFIPPQKGKSHVLRIIYELLDWKYSPATPAANPQSTEPKWWQRLLPPTPVPPNPYTTRLDTALQYFSNAIKKRCTAFVLSDFIANDYQKALQLAARKHDIVGIHLYDPYELALPQVGVVPISDPETGKIQWIDTQNADNKRHYRAHYLQQLDYCRTAFTHSNADLISIPTNRPYVSYLINFFKQRGAK